MPKIKKEETNPETMKENSHALTEQLLRDVLASLKDLKEALIKPITSQAPPDEPRPSLERVLTNEQGKAPITTSTIPIPLEYRQQVDSVLNSQFGVEMEAAGDPLSMLFTIIVPDKYSPMSASQREMMKRDLRPKVLDRSLGVNGVKEWCDIVYRNFVPEIQAQIVADRSK